MNSLLIPDFLAMTLMLCVLALVHRRYPQYDTRFWMTGLLLILLECAARIVYGMHLPRIGHRVAHAVALDAYLLAGVFFVRSSRLAAHRLPRSGIFKAVNAAPASLFLSGYAAGLTHAAFYEAVALCGVLIAVGSCAVLHRPRAHLITLVLLWAPVVVASFGHQQRLAAYLLLASLYFMTACLFLLHLPPSSSSKIPLVAGFCGWAACFATHPWIAVSHPGWLDFASEIWNLQKFLITVGFVLVLFERQVDGNEWLALHDQLTGLPNRRLFEDRIGNALARAERDRNALILFCLDLNNLKEVNDTLGHDAGDALLRSVATSLQGVVRRTDTLARVGGDEFILLAADVRTARPPKKERRWRRGDSGTLDSFRISARRSDGVSGSHAVYDSNVDGAVDTVGGADDRTQAPGEGASLNLDQALDQAHRIEQSLRSAVNKQFVLTVGSETQTVEASISVGVAIYPTDSTDVLELSRIADGRMYDDKRRQKVTRGGLDRVLSLLTTT